ncbi:histidine kinase [Streptomyces sp. NPDC015127]|uniref:histidine kinase n=1 Tax=Streptomyces sp. NPDC015127 TaxID=3364939 RepID=UPI0036F9CA16
MLLTGLAVGCIAATRTRRAALAAAATALSVQIAAGAFYRTGAQDLASAVVFLVLVAPAWMTRYLIQERREHAETVRAQIAVQAVTAERLRDARELHGMVAHNIGIIAIQAGTGRRIIDTQPEEARKAMAVVEATSRDTPAGLRRMLGVLRRGEPAGAPPAPAPGLADVDGPAATTHQPGHRQGPCGAAAHRNGGP